MIRAIGVGDNFVDRYLFQNTMYPGGNSVNFAVYARMLGHESAYCGVLAEDSYAKMIRGALDAFGVEHTHCTALPDGETGHGSIRLVDGDRVITDDNDNGSVKKTPLKITPELIAYLRGFDLIHSACYGFLEPQLPALAAAGVPIAFDCSENWTDVGYLQVVCPYARLVLFSGSGHPRELLKRRMSQACAFGSDLAIGTIGAEGALVWDGASFYQIAPYRPQSGIVDTMGAGDSFFTGFATTWIDGRKRLMQLMGENLNHDMSAADQADYQRTLIGMSMQVGNAMAMRTCMVSGSFGHGEPLGNEEEYAL